MRDVETIQVQSELDIISARRRVRDLARVLGLNPTDQARISLATSSLAHIIGLGGKHKGKIYIGSLGGRAKSDGSPDKGLWVVCALRCADVKKEVETFTPKAMKDVQWMVDELDIEEVPPRDVRITLIKRMA